MFAEDAPLSWTGAAAAMVGVGMIVVLSGWLVIVFARRAADGRLGRNGWAGVRTRATRSSDVAWLTAHQVALAPTVRGGWVAIATGVLAVPIGLLIGDGDTERTTAAWGVVLVVGTMVMTALVVWGAWRGHAAAKRVAGAYD